MDVFNSSRVPESIGRDKFVEHIFDIGLERDHGYDTLITSVNIGDKYVSCCHTQYSIELACVVAVIGAKLCEDIGYISIRQAEIDTCNRIVYDLEQEICQIMGFHIKNNNYITFISNILHPQSKHLSPLFWDLSKEICLNQSFLTLNPNVILCACFLLSKRNKLKAQSQYKERKFLSIMKLISKEFELDFSHLMKAYITYKTQISS